MTDIIKFERNGSERYIGDSKARNSIANEFSTTTSYKANNLTLYDGQLYKFISDHGAGIWEASQALKINIADKLFKNIGTAYGGSGGNPVNYTVPGNSNNYFLFTTNNQPDSVTFWFIRPESSIAIKLAGGDQISVTMGSSRSITVTSATRNVGVFLMEI